MAISPRLIRRRIRSVANTKKITKAMELVAAAKMRRAVAAALKTRAYAKLAWGMVEALEGTVGEELHPLLRSGNAERRTQNAEQRSILYIVMASDRGLCGGFNAALFRALLNDVQRVQLAAGSWKLVAIGRKAEQFIRRMGWNLAASFTNLSVAPTVAELRPIAKLAMDAFTNGEVDEVRIAFTDFVSSLRQQPRVRTLLPLQRIEEVGIEPEVGSRKSEVATTEFLFEPSPVIVLNAMLPRLVELQIYQCYLETGASEHSARMLAMRNASDSAGEMIDDLTLTFNQARQSLITREIAEISAGRSALSG
jgi:F-type H+-transporting ATPase subunit gamma